VDVSGSSRTRSVGLAVVASPILPIFRTVRRGPDLREPGAAFLRVQAALRESGKAAGTFRHPCRNVDGLVEVVRFPPEAFCLIARAGITLQHGETADGVGEIERSPLVVGSIECQRFLVTTFSRWHATALVVNVAEVPDRVGEEERVVSFAEDGHGFFIVQSGSIAIETSLDLAELAEGLSQFDRSAFLTQEGDGAQEMAPSFGQTPFPASLAGLSQQIVDVVGHGELLVTVGFYATWTRPSAGRPKRPPLHLLRDLHGSPQAI
jgi:hypothetical protein